MQYFQSAANKQVGFQMLSVKKISYRSGFTKTKHWTSSGRPSDRHDGCRVGPETGGRHGADAEGNGRYGILE